MTGARLCLGSVGSLINAQFEQLWSYSFLMYDLFHPFLPPPQQDVIEFDTWRPRSERKFTYLATFAVSAQDQAAMKPSISSSASSSLSLSPAAPKGAVARSPNGRKSTPTKTPTKGVAKISSFFSPSARTSSGSAGDAGVGGAKKKAEADDDVVVVVDSPAKPAFRKMQHQQPETIVIDSPCKKANATAAAGAAAASSATTTTIAGTSATAAAPASGGDGERCVPYAFAVGSIVSVKARLGPGQNKPGGVARILKVDTRKYIARLCCTARTLFSPFSECLPSFLPVVRFLSFSDDAMLHTC